MVVKDVYEQLFDMYNQVPPGSFNVPSVMKVLRLQYTPDEAELAVKVGLRGVKLDQIEQRTGIDRPRLKRILSTMADKGTPCGSRRGRRTPTTGWWASAGRV